MVGTWAPKFRIWPKLQFFHSQRQYKPIQMKSDRQWVCCLLPYLIGISNGRLAQKPLKIWKFAQNYYISAVYHTASATVYTDKGAIWHRCVHLHAKFCPNWQSGLGTESPIIENLVKIVIFWQYLCLIGKNMLTLRWNLVCKHRPTSWVYSGTQNLVLIGQWGRWTKDPQCFKICRKSLFSPCSSKR